MTDEFQDDDISRRLFTLSFAAGAGMFLFSDAARAGGGDRFGISIGGSIEYDDSEQEEEEPPRQYQTSFDLFSQRQFLNMSRSQLRVNMGRDNAFVNGFSPEMSNNLFKMGFYRQALTRALVREMQQINRTGQRRTYLRQQRNEAREELDNYSGSTNGRNARAIFFIGVRDWSRRPREGTLKLNYKY